MTIEDHRLMRREEVLRTCGISKSTLYEMVSEETFPAPVRINRRSVGWRRRKCVVAGVSSTGFRDGVAVTAADSGAGRRPNH